MLLKRNRPTRELLTPLKRYHETSDNLVALRIITKVQGAKGAVFKWMECLEIKCSLAIEFVHIGSHTFSTWCLLFM